MTTDRRSFLRSALAAPFVVRASGVLMPVRSFLLPPPPEPSFADPRVNFEFSQETALRWKVEVRPVYVLGGGVVDLR